MKFSTITLIKVNNPDKHNVNELLQWFGGTLGLFNLRDKDRSCFRIFIILLKNSSSKKGLSSNDIASLTSLTRGTVVYHLNKLMEKGFIIETSNKYYLKVDTLKELATHLESEFSDIFTSLKDVGETLDKKLGFNK